MSKGMRRLRFLWLTAHTERQGGRCAYCTTPISVAPLKPATMMATLDHITPKSKGGEDTEENTCAACWPCNRIKGSFLPEQLWRMADTIDALTNGHRLADLIAGTPMETDMAYKYLVTAKGDGKKRLIEASSPANAIAHVAKDDFTTERVSDAVAGMIGLPVEKVTAAAAPAAETTTTKA